MNINSIGMKKFSPTFGDALSTKQERRYLQLQKEARRLQGHEDGIRIVKLYTPSIPSNEKQDTGIGKPSSSEAIRMYELAQIYGGATAIKFMPMGQLTDKQGYQNGYPGAYQRSALSIGEDIIDLFQLASEKYGHILPQSEAEQFAQEHNKTSKNQNIADFKTTLGWRNQEDYPVNKPLRIAFDNFKNCETPNPELQKLRTEFEAFKNQKEPVDYDDIYTRLALFPYIKSWTTAKTDFFAGFDSDERIREQKMPEYNALKEKYKDEIEFFKFKQFLAHKALSDAKNEVNKLGMDLAGDCAIAFSWAEEQVFPDAFLKDKWGRAAEIGWGIHTLNYYDLINKQNSPAHKLFRAKLAHHLTHYDSIRFDVGWAYMNPSFHFGDNQMIKFDAGTKITDFIEKTAREIKGEDFDQRKLMYECDADGSDFNLWTNGDKLRKVKGLAILSTEEEKNDDANIGWGSLPFFKYNIGLDDDDFIIGTNNHDKEGVLRCAKDNDKSNKHVGALLRTFSRRAQDGHSEGWKLFKDDDDHNEHIRKYTRGRFAEIDLAKHSFIMFTDLFGRMEKIDYHGNDPEHDYKTRLERIYEENYHRAIQDNVGYNAADVKTFAMRMFNVSEEARPVYEALQKYSAYLKHKGGIYTREQADNSSRANLDIEKMSLEEIKKLDYIS
ncbi:MAG: 4-alpha-glucanotransferase [Candidatus Gastranaerophilales bacterium]|nr:4-alpha-glucanotransferase [Candidatus Gastranaerophilales bacterium]